MNVSANIPFEHISLNKDEKDLLSRIVTKPEYATDKSFGSAERLQHYGLAYITVSGNANAPKLKDGATYLIRKSDKGVDFLAYINNQKDKEESDAKMHDWKIALISGLSGALISEAIKWFASLLLG